MPYLIAAVGVLALLVAVIADRVGAAAAGAPARDPAPAPGTAASARRGAAEPSPPLAPAAVEARHAGTDAAVAGTPPTPAAGRPAGAEPGDAAPDAAVDPQLRPTPPQPTLAPAGPVRPVAAAGGGPDWPAAAADLLRALGRLPGVRGWAIVGAEGAVVAADPAMRTALIAGGDELARAAASVAGRLGFSEWRSVELRGPAGSIQAMSGPGGWSLLALLGPEADGGRVAAEGHRILHKIAGG
jgi:predicted regulator of Ras-like GTPase activity (Roadblock/LC7/MglB family)